MFNLVEEGIAHAAEVSCSAAVLSDNSCEEEKR